MEVMGARYSPRLSSVHSARPGARPFPSHGPYSELHWVVYATIGSVGTGEPSVGGTTIPTPPAHFTEPPMGDALLIHPYQGARCPYLSVLQLYFRLLYYGIASWGSVWALRRSKPTVSGSSPAGGTA